MSSSSSTSSTPSSPASEHEHEHEHEHERRADSRHPVDLFVNRFLNGYPYLCRATDISRAGMRLQPLLEPHRDVPRYMGLQFQLPGSEEVITASGEAVFVDGSGPVGIRFTRLPATSASLIDRFLRLLAPEPCVPASD